MLNRKIKLFEIFKYFLKNYLINNLISKKDNWQIFFSKKKNYLIYKILFKILLRTKVAIILQIHLYTILKKKNLFFLRIFQRN